MASELSFSVVEKYIKFSSDFVDKKYSFLTKLNPEFTELRKVQENIDINNFNIFSEISELYRPEENVYKKENPNSEVLRFLLDPNTRKIGDETVLINFFEFIGLQDYKKYFPEIKKIRIEREKHRIDIYIHNDENAVIIESKLHGAPNQDFQLARYYLKAKEDGYEVRKIVYLTLLPVHELNLEDLYSPSKNKLYPMKEQKKYYSLVPEIKKLITYKSAVNNDEKADFSEFFQDCSKSVSNEILRLLLEQYSELLIKLAGETMAGSAEKNLIKKIYEKKDDINNALEFAEVWKEKDEILIEIFKDMFKEAKPDWTEKDDECFYTELKGYKLFVCFYYEKSLYPQIGFSSNKFTKDERNKLEEVLKELYSKKANDFVAESKWVYAEFIYENEPINDYFELFLNLVNQLENKVSEL